MGVSLAETSPETIRPSRQCKSLGRGDAIVSSFDRLRMRVVDFILMPSPYPELVEGGEA